MLNLAYQDLDAHTDRVPDMGVHAATTPHGVMVSYTPPDRPDGRIELEPIPFDLL